MSRNEQGKLEMAPLKDGAVNGRGTGRGPRVGSRFGLGAALGVGLALASGGASAHTSAVPLPPAGDYLVRWYQPHAALPVEDWDVEVTPVQNPAARFIATANVVPDTSCWALDVPVRQPAYVRIRSVAGAQVSAWSRQTIVPEPGMAVGAFSAAALLAALARRRGRGAVRPPR